MRKKTTVDKNNDFKPFPQDTITKVISSFFNPKSSNIPNAFFVAYFLLAAMLLNYCKENTLINVFIVLSEYYSCMSTPASM